MDFTRNELQPIVELLEAANREKDIATSGRHTPYVDEPEAGTAPAAMETESDEDNDFAEEDDDGFSLSAPASSTNPARQLDFSDDDSL